MYKSKSKSFSQSPPMWKVNIDLFGLGMAERGRFSNKKSSLLWWAAIVCCVLFVAAFVALFLVSFLALKCRATPPLKQMLLQARWLMQLLVFGTVDSHRLKTV